MDAELLHPLICVVRLYHQCLLVPRKHPHFEAQGWLKIKGGCVVRGVWCAVRGAWCVVRGAWCVVSVSDYSSVSVNCASRHTVFGCC